MRKMSLKNWTPKITALAVVAIVITLLFALSIPLLWRNQFQAASWRVALGLLLALVFFRHRKIAFVTIALSFGLVCEGLTLPLHPTAVGIVITLLCAALLYSGEQAISASE